MHVIDPIALEVIRGNLIATVAQMRATLIRTAYSPILYDSHDFSCCLLNLKGEIIAMSDEFPGHVFALSWGVRAIMEIFGDDINPGDVIMMNDPYVAGTHLNDVIFCTPFFADGRLIAHIGVLAHWEDVGGATPGSLTSIASHILQEGIRVPPIKIIEGGKRNDSVWKVLFANMRLADEREGDARAMIDTAHIAQVRLSELCAKYGTVQVERYVQAILDGSEHLMRQRISQLPDGDYYHENYLDNSGVSAEPVPIKVKLRIDGDTMTLDFSGSSPQTGGSTNCGACVTAAGAFFVIKSWLDSGTPVNGGALRPIKFVVPEGSVVSARYPAAVGGCWEVKNGVLGAVLGIFAQFMPEDALGGEIQGGAHVIIALEDRATGRPFILYEFPFPGYPGTSHSDGAIGCPAYDHGDFHSIQPAEVIEQSAPLVVEGIEVYTDGEGAGRRRSSFGVVRKVKVLHDAVLSVNGGRFVIPAFGMSGAHAGRRYQWTVLRGDREMPVFSEVPGKVRSFPLQAGDVVIGRAPGGGGVGDPLTRDPQLVRQDVIDGYLSETRAREAYGVVINDGEVDWQETDEARKLLLGRRRNLAVIETEVDHYDERGCRLCLISPAAAAKVGVGDDEVVEYVPTYGAPLRAWVKIDSALTTDGLPLGPVGRKILKVRDKDLVQVRPLI